MDRVVVFAEVTLDAVTTAYISAFLTASETKWVQNWRRSSKSKLRNIASTVAHFDGRMIPSQI